MMVRTSSCQQVPVLGCCALRILAILLVLPGMELANAQQAAAVSTSEDGDIAVPQEPKKTAGVIGNPIDIGSQKQLFMDQQLVATSRNITLTMNPPRRDGQVLLTTDQPWEKGAFISVYSSVLKDNDRIRLWYDLMEKTGAGPYDHERRVGYAESKDGLHFEKPLLGLHSVDGSTANNVVLPTKIGGCSVWIDPQAPSEHRFKTQAKVYPSGEFHMHSSPDGLRWTLFSKPHPGPGGHDTQSIVFWDRKVNRYALYTRHWMHQRDRQRAYRAVRRLETDDLKTGWDQQAIVMAPDEIDWATHATPTEQPPVDFYGACVFPYEDVYIMLLQAYWHWDQRSSLKRLGPLGFDVRLAISRDGKTFSRVGGRKPFMANGREDQFDSRFVWALPNPVRMGDEIWIYYVGQNRGHDGRIAPGAPEGKLLTGIGRAVIRLDGFVSVDAGYRGGQFTTPLIRFSGDRLELNVDTSGGGSVEVELLDEQEQPIQGYARNESQIINGNSVRMPVRWQQHEDVGELAGRPIRLRFYLRDCKLYSFQFRTEGATVAVAEPLR